MIDRHLKFAVRKEKGFRDKSSSLYVKKFTSKREKGIVDMPYTSRTNKIVLESAHLVKCH